MATGCPSRAGPRGGDGIQALRQGDARVGAAVASVVGSLGLAAVAARTAAEIPGVALAGGVAGAALVAVGLGLRRATPVTAGLALTGAAYGLSLVGKGLDPAAGVVAGGFLLVAELAYWALEPGAAVPLGRGATFRRAISSLALALGAVALGTLLLGVAAAPAAEGPAVGIAGVAAIATVVLVVGWLVHALRPRGPVR